MTIAIQLATITRYALVVIFCTLVFAAMARADAVKPVKQPVKSVLRERTVQKCVGGNCRLNKARKVARKVWAKPIAKFRVRKTR